MGASYLHRVATATGDPGRAAIRPVLSWPRALEPVPELSPSAMPRATRTMDAPGIAAARSDARPAVHPEVRPRPDVEPGVLAVGVPPATPMASARPAFDAAPPEHEGTRADATVTAQSMRRSQPARHADVVTAPLPAARGDAEPWRRATDDLQVEPGRVSAALPRGIEAEARPPRTPAPIPGARLAPIPDRIARDVALRRPAAPSRPPVSEIVSAADVEIAPWPRPDGEAPRPPAAPPATRSRGEPARGDTVVRIGTIEVVVDAASPTTPPALMSTTLPVEASPSTTLARGYRSTFGLRQG